VIPDLECSSDFGKVITLLFLPLQLDNPKTPSVLVRKVDASLYGHTPSFRSSSGSNNARMLLLGWASDLEYSAFTEAFDRKSTNEEHDKSQKLDKIVFAVAMTERERTEHNRAFEKASAIVMDEIKIHDRPPLSPPGWWVRRKLKRALALFDQVLTLKPENWSAMWLVGKVHQRLGDDATALAWFERAYQVNPSQPDVAREASLCAMDIGNGDAAVVYAYRATQIEPDSGGLHANLALAYVIAGSIDKAAKSIERALALDPSDGISKVVSEMIRHFASTGVTSPKTAKELERYWRSHRSGARQGR
jgi:tetratricopeptide (TPR) repeat protein